VAEEPAFERFEELLVAKRSHLLLHAFLSRDLEVVEERVVGGLESIPELVSLEDVIVPPRLGVGPIPEIDRTPNGPESARAALDPDDDLLAAAVLPEPVQDPLGEARPRRFRSHGRRIQSPPVGILSRIFGQGDAKREAPRGISKEEALAAYIIREHRSGRSLEDIIDDPYLKNRSTEEQRLRLLERADVIRAVGEDTAAMAAQQVKES
jgi:hypothetical protein